MSTAGAVDKPAYRLRSGQVIEVVERAELVPAREEIPIICDEHSVIEYYAC